MRQYQPTPDFYHDYIAHHGILGMSWGERNGPPYPLDSDVSTGKSLRKKKKNKGENRVDTKQSDDKNVKKADSDGYRDPLSSVFETMNINPNEYVLDEKATRKANKNLKRDEARERRRLDKQIEKDTKQLEKELDDYKPLYNSGGSGSAQKQSKHDQKLQKEHDNNVKKAERDFQETHKLFTTSDGKSSWYVGTGHDERMKDGMSRYQTLSLKGKNGSTDHYHIDRKYNVIVQKTTEDRNDNLNISSFDKNDKDLIAKLRKQQQKQWDRERW